MDEEELMMLALDAGAEDFVEEEDSYEITTVPDDFSAGREALEAAGIKPPRSDEDAIKQRSKEKRIRAKQNRIVALKDFLDASHSVSNGLLVQVDKNNTLKITRLDFANDSVIKTPFYISAPDLENESHLYSYNDAYFNADNTVYIKWDK